MLKKLSILFFFYVIILLFFSIKYYISDDNIKKTYRNLSSVDENINIYKKNLPVIFNDTDKIVKYLNNGENSNKKKYSFWNLLKNEN